MRRIRMLGATRVSQLHALLSARMDAWNKAWTWAAGEGEPVSLALLPLNGRGSYTPERLDWHVYAAGSVRLAIGYDQGALAPEAAGAASSQGRLSRSVGTMMLKDLASRISGEARLDETGTELDPADMEGRLGNVVIQARTASARFTLILSAELVWKLSPVAPSIASGLTPIAACLPYQPVTTSAYLSLGSLTLGEMMSLKPGDILVTKAALDQPLQLLTEAGRRKVASAFLGQGAQRRRALALATTFNSPIPPENLL